MVTAYFDFDGTLIAGDSDLLLYRHTARMGRLTEPADRAMRTMLDHYHGGTLGPVQFQEFLRARVAEWTPVAFTAAAAACFHEAAKPTVFPAAMEWIARHRAQGHRIVLISGGPQPLIAEAGRFLQADAAFGSDMEVADGRFTGRVREPVPFGSGKLRVAQSDAAAAGVALADCYFYSDSHLDLPLLQAVGFPVVVNPDPRLALEATAAGWPQYRVDGGTAAPTGGR